MHPEADAFLDAIFDQPDDDTPRLVYADWLQEHGQENYAQFIRLQCAAAREKLWSDEANRLWEEIGRVWNRLDAEWLPAMREEWPYLSRPSGLLDAVHFHRGFPQSPFTMADDQLVRFTQGEVWLPWLIPPDCTLLITPVGNWEQLASIPGLRRVAELQLDGYDVGWETEQLPGEIVGLLRSSHLCNLQMLDLSELLLTHQAVTALLEAPNLSSIQRLRVELSRERGPDPTVTVPLLQERFKDVVWTNDWDSE
jgi:uncharacterized protein (TIGR02996 family)